MATYVNNLRLKEIATGDESGTWGTSTNTNLELIGEGLGYGTEQVAADANETFTMADGAADGVRAMYLKFTSAGSLTATRTLTLAPNTVSKFWIIENATTGGQIITIKQGSGATVDVGNGDRVFLYTDGAGGTGAVFRADPSLTAGADIASATATDLTAATGNTVVITGTTTATSLTMNVGQQMILLPSGAWPLTYHATTMNINGGVSYTCAAGDRIYAVKDLAGVIRVSVFKQDGTSLVPGAASSVAVGDITGAGTGVLTALAVNVGSAGAPVVLDGALGTPSGGTATNLTGLPPAGVTGTAAILGANTFTALQIQAAGADIASATATDLTGATGNVVVITGTTESTSLTMTKGQQMTLIAAAAWPLTFHATTMNINGGVSYTCAAGDRIYAVKDDDDVIQVSVIKQDGTALVSGGASGALLRITRYDSAGSGTWTRGADTVSVRIMTVGAGGGGGGAAGGKDGASGGGAGGTALLYVASAASTYAYVVGAGGAGNTASGTGSAGTATTIAGITGGGGSGGGTGNSQGGAGGTPANGDVNITGSNGSPGAGFMVYSYSAGGSGGASSLGGAGGGGQALTSAGSVGTFGGGGGGGGSTNGDGAAGGAGYIEVKEYS
jgi:hypothetical protein